MKNLNLTAGLALLLSASLLSCEKADDKTVSVTQGLVPMTVSAYVDATDLSRTTYSGRKVFWEDSDEITIYSIGSDVTRNGFKAESLSEDRSQAEFSGYASADAVSYVAVYPHDESGSYDKATGTLAVNIPSEQIGVPDSFASGANVSAAEFTDETAVMFRNISSMLCFKFDTPEDAAATKSVTFKAKKNETEYWGISGTASVSFESGTSVPVAAEGSEKQVTLLAPQSGFVSGAVYYIPVYPVGVCTGFEVTFTDKSDETFVKKNGLEATLLRNNLLNIGAVPDPYNTIPDEMTVSIDFYNDEIKWPFKEWVMIENQSVDGDSHIYTHKYMHDGRELSKELEFIISKGAVAGSKYEYSTFSQLEGGKKVLFLNKENCWIKLPGIPGMYLKSVSMSHGNKDQKKRFRLQVGTDVGATAYYNSPIVTAASYTSPATSTVTFPTGDSTMGNLKTTQKGNSYVMFFTKGGSWSPVNMRVFNITLVYTRSAPE